MPTALLRPSTKLELGDAVELIARYARQNPEDFVMGPLSLAALKDGLTLTGNIRTLLAILRRQLPELSIEEWPDT